MTAFDIPCTRRQALAVLAVAWPAAHVRARTRTDSAPEAPRLALLSEARPDIDPSGYLVSEKLDGVRAFWDGSRLRFRSGLIVRAPEWFTAALPPVVLDGELWGGRESFDFASGTVRRITPDDASWRTLRLMVFDLPGETGDFATRTARIAALAAAASSSTVWAAVEQTQIPDRTALQQRLASVVRGGGEGLVLHRADAPWSPGRSRALWKLKPLHDAEAQVLAHEPGRGRLADMMGAVRVRNAGGIEFRIGTGFTDAQRRDPPPVGSWISYTHRGVTASGVPRFASYWRPHDAEL
jgi:DNA ligase-1